MRIVVIGGAGFVGQRTVEALRALPGVEVEVAGRRGPVVVDVTRPETFGALRGAAVIVDVSNGTRSAPDALATFCLAEGLTLLEATSDADAVRRLVDTHAGSTGPGRLVLGAGLFTGLSQLLARDVADEAGPDCALTWAVSSSPYSGAGAGTIALMVDASARPAVVTRDGRRVTEPLGRGPTLSFAGAARPSLRASLAEAELLPRSTKARDVECLMALRPGLLVTLFVLLPAFLARQRWFQWLLEVGFTVVRRGLLRSVPTAVHMVARAERAGRIVERQLTCRDGMEVCGWAIAVMAEAVGKTPPRSGVSCIDDVVRLEPVVARLHAVSGRELVQVTPAAVVTAASSSPQAPHMTHTDRARSGA
ncbi:MAG: hypothetical protein SFW67_06530 [Myxococcaceae bacterium]|nr:hypothetical protein [Myxococcaceae bacterium]